MNRIWKILVVLVCFLYFPVLNPGVAPPVIAQNTSGMAESGSADSSPEKNSTQKGGVFRVIIDPASAPLKWQKKSQDSLSLPSADALTLDIALELRRILRRQEGIEVLLTSQENQRLSLDEKIERINTSGADALVCLRLNASPNENLKGVEIFIASESLDPAASEAVHLDKGSVLPLAFAYLPFSRESMVLAQDLASEGERILQSRISAITPAPLYLCRRIAMPSVMIGCGYISNAEDANQLSKDRYIEKLGNALAQGLIQYIRKSSGSAL